MGGEGCYLRLPKLWGLGEKRWVKRRRHRKKKGLR